MRPVVVDASVAIKWYIPEIHASHAAHLLSRPVRLLAPDLIYAEMGNVLWKKTRRKEVCFSAATEIFAEFRRVPLKIYEHPYLADLAWQLAGEQDCTFYDALYVALSYLEKCPLITADRALYDLFQPSNKNVYWVEEVKKLF